MPWVQPEFSSVNVALRRFLDFGVLIQNLVYLKNVLDGVESQNVTLGQNLTVIGGLTSRPYVFERWPAASDLILRSSTVQVVAAGGSGNLTFNAYYDGTSWNRLDTTRPAAQLVTTPAGGVQINVAAAGANPVYWTPGLTVFNSGGVYIGSDPIDPGSGNLQLTRSGAGYLICNQVVATLTLRVGTNLVNPNVNNALIAGYLGLGINAIPSYRLQLANASGPDGQGIAVAWLTYSSAEFKENIRPIDSPIAKVKSLMGRRFKWKDSGSEGLGLVAEEVAAAVPEAVVPDKEGRPLALNVVPVVAVLVEAVKELADRVERLERRQAA